jgi:hypothetical protein
MDGVAQDLVLYGPQGHYLGFKGGTWGFEGREVVMHAGRVGVEARRDGNMCGRERLSAGSRCGVDTGFQGIAAGQGGMESL